MDELAAISTGMAEAIGVRSWAKFERAMLDAGLLITPACAWKVGFGFYHFVIEGNEDVNAFIGHAVEKEREGQHEQQQQDV